VRAGIAVKPEEYTWRQLAGAGALAGIGFTMSLFIAGQAFPSAPDFSAAKVAVFAASILSAVVGTALLFRVRSLSKRRRRAPACKYHSPPAFRRDLEQEVFR
jgi:Na+/H+ antiporter NhaA